MIKVPPWYIPRDYQLPIWKSMIEEDKKRGLLLWPRRHGKDLTCFNIMVYHAAVLRVGNYYYFAPSYAQGEKILWDGKTKDGRPFMSCIPGWPNTVKEDPNSIIDRIDQRKMKVWLTNGSLIQIVGASEEDAVVGTNPVGCVFTEYSVQDPRFYQFMLPILVENNGWALFAYTMRGLNHGWQLYEQNKDNPDWHVEFHTVETTLHDGKRVVTDADIDMTRREGWPEDMIRQEFYNDPYASNIGSYYSQQMRRALDEGRICSVPWQPSMPVHTAWDIGHADATAIWFVQVDSYGNVNVIDFYQNSGEGLIHYVKYLKNKPYVYGSHMGPHDLANHNFQTGQTTLEAALAHGLRFTVVPKISVNEGINAARNLIERCRFDEQKCAVGLEALRQYAKKETGIYDLRGKPIFADKPKHDWTSHPADGYRYLAVAIEKVLGYNGSDMNGDVLPLPDEAIFDHDVLEF